MKPVSPGAAAEPPAAPPPRDALVAAAETADAPARPARPAMSALAGARSAASAVVAVAAGAAALAGYETARVDVERGFRANGGLLIAFIAAAGWASWRHGELGKSRWANAWLAFALVPLVQLIAIAAPHNAVAPAERYGLIAVPLLAAAVCAVRASGYSRRDLGLVMPWSWLGAPLTLITVASGVGAGYLIRDALPPSQFVDWPLASPRTLGLVALIGLAALAEELIFRGVILRAMRDLLGPALGVLAAAALYTSLAAGQFSPLEAAAVFVIAALLGAAVILTRSLAGAVAAHGLAIVCALLVLPRYL